MASAKQCGRAVVPAIDPPAEFAQVVADAADPVRLVLVEPAQTAAGVPAALGAVAAAGGGDAGDRARGRMDRRGSREPRGAAGWTPVRLGARTLRASAMALVALAACQAVWADAE